MPRTRNLNTIISNTTNVIKVNKNKMNNAKLMAIIAISS